MVDHGLEKVCACVVEQLHHTTLGWLESGPSRYFLLLPNFFTGAGLRSRSL